MKHKEIKETAWAFNSCETVEGKIEIVGELFQNFFTELHKAKNKSPAEALGIIKKHNMAWRDLCFRLDPIKEDLYLHDLFFLEYFYKNSYEHFSETYDKDRLGLIIKQLGSNLNDLKEDTGFYAEIEEPSEARDFRRFNEFRRTTTISPQFKAIYQ